MQLRRAYDAAQSKLRPQRQEQAAASRARSGRLAGMYKQLTVSRVGEAADLQRRAWQDEAAATATATAATQEAPPPGGLSLPMTSTAYYQRLQQRCVACLLCVRAACMATCVRTCARA